MLFIKNQVNITDAKWTIWQWQLPVLGFEMKLPALGRWVIGSEADGVLLLLLLLLLLVLWFWVIPGYCSWYPGSTNTKVVTPVTCQTSNIGESDRKLMHFCRGIYFCISCYIFICMYIYIICVTLLCASFFSLFIFLSMSNIERKNYHFKGNAQCHKLLVYI